MKVTFNLTSHQVDYLNWLAKKQNTTKERALIKALATECYLHQEKESGGQILIKKGDSIKELSIS